MFNFFKKPSSSSRGSGPGGDAAIHTNKISNLNLKLSGLHCTSCAVDIDLTLEDLPGVINSKTNYAKSISVIDFEPDKISPEKITEQITNLGYEVI